MEIPLHIEMYHWYELRLVSIRGIINLPILKKFKG